MLIYAATVSADGFINDRNGGIDWSGPDDELFAAHLARVRTLGGTLLGRRLYETMSVWETDPALRATPDFAAFADAWTALPKVVFSRSPLQPGGTARAATASVAEEIEAMRSRTDRDLEIGGATLAAQALALGLVDDIRIFRAPMVLGGGTPFFPPLKTRIPLELVDTRRFAPGIVYEHYLVSR